MVHIAQLNPQKNNVLQSIEEMKVITLEPPSELISFIQEHHDIIQMSFGLDTACCDEFSRWVLIDEAVSLRFYTELDEKDWGLYLEINTDLFVPF